MTCEALLLHSSDLLDSSFAGALQAAAETGPGESRRCHSFGDRVPYFFEHSFGNAGNGLAAKSKPAEEDSPYTA